MQKWKEIMKEGKVLIHGHILQEWDISSTRNYSTGEAWGKYGILFRLYLSEERKKN